MLERDGERAAAALIASTFSEEDDVLWRRKLAGRFADMSIEQIAETGRPQLMQITLNPLGAYLAYQIADSKGMSRRGWIIDLVVNAIVAEHPEVDKELLWRRTPSPFTRHRKPYRARPGDDGPRKRRRAQPNDSANNSVDGPGDPSTAR